MPLGPSCNAQLCTFTDGLIATNAYSKCREESNKFPLLFSRLTDAEQHRTVGNRRPKQVFLQLADACNDALQDATL